MTGKKILHLQLSTHQRWDKRALGPLQCDLETKSAANSPNAIHTTIYIQFL